MALTGHHLVVGQEPIGFWVKYETPKDDPNKILKASGITIEMLEILSEKLNFTYTLMRPPDHAIGYVMPNGSHGGIVGYLHNKVMDVTLVPFSIMVDRLNQIDYGSCILIVDFSIMIPRPKLEKDLLSFFKPFSLQVWLFIFAIMLFGVIIGILLQYLTNKLMKTADGKEEITFRTEWIYKLLLDEGVLVLPTTSTGKVFLTSWLLGALVLMAAFRSILTSILIVPKINVDVDSLKDIVLSGKYKWYVQRGLGILDTLRTSGLPEELEFYRKIEYVNNCLEVRDKILNKNRALLCGRDVLLLMMNEDFSRNGYCNYYILKNRVFTSPLAAGFQQQSKIREKFDSMYVQFAENGILHHKIKNRYQNATNCLVPPGKEKYKNISLTFSVYDLSGIFLMLGIGYGLSFVVFLGELICHKYHQEAPN